MVILQIHMVSLSIQLIPVPFKILLKTLELNIFLQMLLLETKLAEGTYQRTQFKQIPWRFLPSG